VDGIHELVPQLRARGAQVTREPAQLPGAGIWIATLRDPQGNYVQLVQRPPR
jgi:predicted enzyme related to lactoylglutathione lyase